MVGVHTRVDRCADGFGDRQTDGEAVSTPRAQRLAEKPADTDPALREAIVSAAKDLGLPGPAASISAAARSAGHPGHRDINRLDPAGPLPVCRVTPGVRAAPRLMERDGTAWNAPGDGGRPSTPEAPLRRVRG
jgi:hypothetical protein